MTTVKASRSKKLSRAPGQFLTEEKERRFDGVLFYILAIGMAWLMAILEVMNWFSKEKLNPWLFVAVAVIVTAFSLYKLIRFMKEVRTINQGIHGERIVADFLWEKIVPNGYFLLNDVPGDFGNIDHVLIGKTGVFCLETKMFSKRDDGQPNKISVESGSLRRNGAKLSRDPIKQVIGLTQALEGLIGKRTQIKVRPIPVVVFPGCWFQDRDRYLVHQGVRVLNPAYIENFVLEYNKPTLAADAVRAIHQGLNDYVKDQRGND